MSDPSSFLSAAEQKLASEFLNDGYVINNVEDVEALEEIRSFYAKTAAVLLGKKAEDAAVFLNNAHHYVGMEKLNEWRLAIIQRANSLEHFRRLYFSLARQSIEALVGNELAMQTRINLSIQFPNDNSSLLPIHADVWSGDSPFEVVVWVPLVDCFGTKSMFLLPPKPAKELHSRFSDFKGKDSESIFKNIESKLHWIDIAYGQVLVFNQTLPHGNRINKESETRWSLNCRFKSIFSPYRDKKLGEFFEPVTLRPASRIGMNYRYPKLEGLP